MPSDLQIRQAVRYATRWSLRVSTIGWEEDLTMETVDLSRGGAFIRTEISIPEDTQLQLTFLVPDQNAEVDVFARVVRCVDAEMAAELEMDVGVGVEFVEPTVAFLGMIDSLLRTGAPPASDMPPGGMQFIDPQGVDPSLMEEDGPTQQLGQEWWKGSLDDLRGEFKQRQTQHRREMVEQIRQETGGGPAQRAADDPERLHKEAEKLYEAGDALGARAIASDLMNHFPDNLPYVILFHLASGKASKAKGNLPEAVVHWKQVVAIDATCADAVAELREAGFSEKKQKRFLQEMWEAFKSMFTAGS